MHKGLHYTTVDYDVDQQVPRLWEAWDEVQAGPEYRRLHYAWIVRNIRYAKSGKYGYITTYKHTGLKKYWFYIRIALHTSESLVQHLSLQFSKMHIYGLVCYTL